MDFNSPCNIAKKLGISAFSLPKRLKPHPDSASPPTYKLLRKELSKNSKTQIYQALRGKKRYYDTLIILNIITISCSSGKEARRANIPKC